MSTEIVVCFFWKEHMDEKQCLKCGKPRYIEVVNDDGETVTTEVAHKQVRYMPITPRLKQMFVSERTMIHMRWHKDGEKENKEVMVHPSDSDAWKVLDKTLIQSLLRMREMFALGWRLMTSHLSMTTQYRTPTGLCLLLHTIFLLLFA
jgi:alkylated DNA repair dioxygenase AlkB